MAFLKEHPTLVDDSPSISSNLKGFIEHRFDQSIYSILAKLNHLECLSAKEVSSDNWEEMNSFPILEKKIKK